MMKILYEEVVLFVKKLIKKQVFLGSEGVGLEIHQISDKAIVTDVEVSQQKHLFFLGSLPKNHQIVYHP